MISNTEKELKIGQITQDTMENILKGKNTEEVYLILRMGLAMKVSIIQYSLRWVFT